MFSSEVKIISVANKGSCNRDTPPHIKQFKNNNQTQVQKTQKTCPNSNNANRSKKINSVSGNRKKIYYNNNSNSIKNQNIPINKSIQATANVNNENNSNSKKSANLSLRPKHPGNQAKTAESTANAKTSADPQMAVSNEPITAQTSAYTASNSGPPSPSRYSLEFLHTVGFHYDPGRALSPMPSPSRHIPYLNSIRNKYSFPQGMGRGSSQAKAAASFHSRASLKEYLEASNAQPGRTISSPLAVNGYMYQGCITNNNYYGPHQYYHSQHNIPYPGNASHYSNRGQHARKNWNWNQPPQQSIKKNYNGNTNKFGNAPKNEIDTSQTLPRTNRNPPCFRNFRHFFSDATCYLGNSRSPTPSPKSESPSLCKGQNGNAAGNLPPIHTDKGALPTSLSAIEISGPHSNMNGYESDSSHSSYRHSDFEYRSKNPSLGGYSVDDVSSVINFQTYSEEDLLKHQDSFCGSQQNLTFWNAAFNPSYSFYNSGGQSSSDSGSYMNDNLNPKRSQSHHRSYRGRRQVYPLNFRPYCAPTDKYLARAHLIELKETPKNLLNGSKWDQLSQGIWTKFVTSQQTEQTYRKKINLWSHLYGLIKKAYPRYGLYLVGSTYSGFGADNSDVDMCLVCKNISTIDPRAEAVANLNQVKEFLSQAEYFDNFNLIEAKVPILRFRDCVNMLEVDLNFNNCVGIRNTQLLHCYSQLDWRLRPLVLVTKLWAQYHDINNAKNMTISSYSLVLMVIHFLQSGTKPPVLPCLHLALPDKFDIIQVRTNDIGGFLELHEDLGPLASKNTQTLGELFVQFLEYYSNFEYSKYAISVRTGDVLPIDECRYVRTSKNDIHQWKELCIEEPFDLTNTARSVYDGETFERVKSVFKESWKVLQETLDLNSVFTPLVQPTPPKTAPEVPLDMLPMVS